MLTEEQIKNLKEGDKLLAEVQFHSFAPYYGDVMCLAPFTSVHGDATKASSYYQLSCLSLPPAKPKYDPNRKFRKGDIVEPCKGREVYACELEDCVFHKMDGKYKVQGDEKEGHVSVIDKKTGIECYISAFALKLVIPVEEQVSFRVGNFPVDGEWHVWKDYLGKTEIVSAYKIDTHPNAYEAAEAERDRLNAKHRKENN